MQLSAVLTPAERGRLHCPQSGDIDQYRRRHGWAALAGLKEAVELYLEVAPLRVLGNVLLDTITVNDHAASAAA